MSVEVTSGTQQKADLSCSFVGLEMQGFSQGLGMAWEEEEGCKGARSCLEMGVVEHL